MVHKYNMNGYYIVIDSNSGSIHVVDEIVYDVLDFYQDNDLDNIQKKLGDKHDKNKIEECYLEVQELEKQDLLFSKDIYKGMMADINGRDPVVKALCLHIAHDCNLKCAYCFAEEGEYKGKRSLMSLEVGKQAIDFILSNSGSRKNLEIDFFGGEPLMNFEVVKGIVAYGREKEKEYNKNIRFTITTNGLLLNDDKLEYINETMDNVVLSIDGRKNVNDKMRKCHGDKSSYDIIVPKFKKLAESRNHTNYYVRGTFTRENLDFSEDVMHLQNLGFKQISIEPVVADEKEWYAIRQEDIAKICDEYEKLAKDMLKSRKAGENFNFFHFMIDLSGGPCATKRLIGCGAGTEYLAVTPEGDLYPCHQFVGMDEFKMGTVTEGVINTEKYEEFEKSNIYAKEDCTSCWGRFYCSGGCAANAYSNHGNILSTYKLGCDMQLKRTECAIMMEVARAYD